MEQLKKQKSMLGEDDGSVQPFYATFIPRKGGTFKINIHGPIYSADQFILASQALEAADEEDTIEISLQSPGGSLDVTDYFIHCMRKTAGHIHISASGNVSSAATLILLQADSFDLSEHFNSTLHSGSIGSGGNYNEYRAQVAFYPQWMEKALRSGYEGFVSEKELDDMLEGKDIILDAAGWLDRYNKRNEYFLAKEAAAKAPVKKSRKKSSMNVPPEL